jgi:hypothetical protein
MLDTPVEEEVVAELDTNDEEEVQSEDDEVVKPEIGLGTASPSSPPPPPPQPSDLLPAAPAGPPPELPSIETRAAEDLAGKESPVSSSRASGSGSSDASADEEAGCRAQTSSAEPGSPQRSPSAHSAASLLAYLPAGSPAPCAVSSPSTPAVAQRLAAFEENISLPKMPPPSPVTPSATVAYVERRAAQLQNAEFAQAAGAALGRLAASGQCEASPFSVMHDLAAEPIAEETCSPAAPLSPLSLESQSPRLISPGKEEMSHEEEVKLET